MRPDAKPPTRRTLTEKNRCEITVLLRKVFKGRKHPWVESWVASSGDHTSPRESVSIRKPGMDVLASILMSYPTNTKNPEISLGYPVWLKAPVEDKDQHPRLETCQPGRRGLSP